MGNKRKKKKNSLATKQHQQQRPTPTVAPAPAKTDSLNRGVDRSCSADYSRYKENTRAFKDGLSRMLPSTFALKKVSDLGSVAEFNLEKVTKEPVCAAKDASVIKTVVSKEILNCLDESIHLRESFASVYFGEDQDEGHRYMVGVLKYCRALLRRSRLVYLERQSILGKARVPENSLEEAESSRFGALKLDDDDAHMEKVGAKEEEYLATYESEPKLEEPKREYSIESDLIEGFLFFRAIRFLLSVDLIFANVTHQFKRLKIQKQPTNEDRQFQARAEQRDTVFQLMEVAALTNMAIDDIRNLEQALFVDCPQLATSFYHVLAAFRWTNVPQFLNLQDQIDPMRLAKNQTCY